MTSASGCFRASLMAAQCVSGAGCSGYLPRERCASDSAPLSAPRWMARITRASTRGVLRTCNCHRCQQPGGGDRVRSDRAEAGEASPGTTHTENRQLHRRRNFPCFVAIAFGIVRTRAAWNGNEAARHRCAFSGQPGQQVSRGSQDALLWKRFHSRESRFAPNTCRRVPAHCFSSEDDVARRSSRPRNPGRGIVTSGSACFAVAESQAARPSARV